MAEIVRKSSSLTHLLLTHNVVRDAGATKMEKALQENWTLLKLALEGNNFDVELAQRMADYVARNNKMHTLSLLQSQNQREFERVKERVQPPPWETGHRPVRFAHEIDISRTDPRMYAALEKVWLPPLAVVPPREPALALPLALPRSWPAPPCSLLCLAPCLSHPSSLASLPVAESAREPGELLLLRRSVSGKPETPGRAACQGRGVAAEWG